MRLVLVLFFSTLCPLSFSIILMVKRERERERERESESERERELVAILWLSSWCLVAVSGLWLFLMVPWVGLQCVIVVVPDHTH